MEESRWKYPSLFRLPTALFHLITMEMIPIWGFGASSVTLALHISSYDVRSHTYLKDKMYCHESQVYATSKEFSAVLDGVPNRTSLLVTEKCIDSKLSKEIDSPWEAKISECPGCEEGGVLDCTISEAKLENAAMWAGAGWCGFVLAVVMAAYVLVVYALKGRETSGGFYHSFGSGAYMLFCWNLEANCVYKALVGLTGAYAMVFVGVVIWQFFPELADQRDSYTALDHLTLMAKGFGIDMAVLIVCVKKLWTPPVQVHHWVDDFGFSKVIFKRGWAELHEGNDTFGQKLVDSLWRARNGQMKQLKALFSEEASGMSAEEFVAICSALQSNEPSGSTTSSGEEEEEDGQEMKQALYSEFE